MKDKIGIVTSVLCLIHCVTFPLLFSAFPMLGLVDHPLEWILLIVAFIVGGWSLFDNLRKHKYFTSVTFFIFGFLAMGFAMYTGEHSFNFIGLPMLMIAHYSNWKYIQKVDGCHPHKCKHEH